MDLSVIYCLFGSKENAANTVKIIIENKLAACANIYNNVRSFYYWDNEVKNSDELAVIIKTTSDLVEKVIKKIKEYHEYECPCILSFKVDNGYQNYLDWVNNSVNKIGT